MDEIYDETSSCDTGFERRLKRFLEHFSLIDESEWNDIYC